VQTRAPVKVMHNVFEAMIKSRHNYTPTPDNDLI
jgi:hypothetical protein